MGAVVEVAYFNSFLLRDVGTGTINFNQGAPANQGTYTDNGMWPSLSWNPIGFPTFPLLAEDPDTLPYEWYVEEARIRGGYNNTSIELGPRAYITEENDNARIFTNSLIYSGVFNSKTDVNNTNVFSVADDITKSLDPRNGSIQFIHARDTDLTVFQTEKVNKVLIDKDALYTAEGNPVVTTAQAVIGTVTPYEGNYGISTQPESFAYYGFRRYFADVNRGAIMRLSRDGLTEISSYGMSDYFRDKLGNVDNDFKIYSIDVNTVNVPINNLIQLSDASNVEIGMQVQFNNAVTQITYVTSVDYTANAISCIDNIQDTPTVATFQKQVKDKIRGGWDAHNKNYVLSIQNEPTSEVEEPYYTLSFDDSINGWVSFFDYKPDQLNSLKTVYYTFKGVDLYRHYEDSVGRNNFYGQRYGSSIEFIFNASPSTKKVFQTINYEGYSGWEVESFISSETGVESSGNFDVDTTKPVLSYQEGLYQDPLTGQPKRAGFDRKENLYVANLISSSPARPGEIIFGSAMTGIKGFFATVKIKTDDVTDVFGPKELFSVGSTFATSS